MHLKKMLYRGLNLVAILGCTLLLACGNPALRDARSLAQTGHHEEALLRLKQATADDPDDVVVKAAMIKQRDTTVAYLMGHAEAARAGGLGDEAKKMLERLETAAPGNPRAAWLQKEIERGTRHRRLMTEATNAVQKKDWSLAEAALRTIVSEDAGHAAARSMLNRLDEQRAEETRAQSTLQLATASKTITLEFRDAALRVVFETLARAADVNFIFDKDVRSDIRLTLFLRNTTVNEALRVILDSQQLGAKLLNANTVLVFPNTAQKQRDLLDTVTRSFYLVNADPKHAMTVVRTLVKTRDLVVDERLNLLIVRDTPEVVRLVERLIESIDLPDPEVVLELEVMEVSTKRFNELGLSWPTSASFGVPGSTAPLTSGVDGLRWSMASPLAVASLRGSTDATNLLANPKIRARNREKAKVLLGEKLPVFTSNLVPGLSGAASTTVSYVDVGLKLEIEPQVQLDNEVIMKVALEVSSVTGKVAGPQGSLAYQVGTRQANTSLRLRDGETQILAGLISDEDAKNSSGIPGLHELPVLGRLFGSTSDTRNKTEVVLLITPHIVRNLSQPPGAVMSSPSGTESQPGSMPWTIRGGHASVMPGPSSNGEHVTTGVNPSSRVTTPTTPKGERMTGPDRVAPGTSFQITVHNPTPQALNTALIYDATAFEFNGAAEPGRVPVMVAPQSSLAYSLTVKTGTGERETQISLGSGSTSITVRIQDPGPGGQAPGGMSPRSTDP